MREGRSLSSPVPLSLALPVPCLARPCPAATSLAVPYRAQPLEIEKERARPLWPRPPAKPRLATPRLALPSLAAPCHENRKERARPLYRLALL
jgi:hypothetical protein